ncbi:StbB family protein [Vibrio alginolyticus]|uniref:StbB family protein n=1 Tax=Vibrio alginolyticus TaxID=663 RepID=UPI000722AF58|nr:StbB family protein [Vibrio alginolyticus]ALR95842.1 transcriptional regulator [Vibrio alginolyticus]MBY7710622.1 transcriptional regulator [Vibrio alginolyticus]
MNIAIVNNSGNVGKSTICENLLKPRIKNAEIIKVETINSDGTNDDKYSAKEYNKILKEMDMNDVSILDVGSSNIEQLIEQMKQYKESHEDIDYFIIPVTSKNKQQMDSLSTVSTLIDLGVDSDKFKFIYNQADRVIPFQRQYATFLNGIEAFNFPTDIRPTIYETEAFSLLASIGKTFQEITNDNRDFRQLLREAETREQKEELSELRTMKQLVNGFNDILDAAFLSLNLK